ncbi:hypothetical protein HK405_015002 [Cladochytrium tenue]|nr:hypothetical protein HK405_015002 [Cladochytrium tenue]
MSAGDYPSWSSATAAANAAAAALAVVRPSMAPSPIIYGGSPGAFAPPAGSRSVLLLLAAAAARGPNAPAPSKPRRPSDAITPSSSSSAVRRAQSYAGDLSEARRRHPAESQDIELLAPVPRKLIRAAPILPTDYQCNSASGATATPFGDKDYEK